MTPHDAPTIHARFQEHPDPAPDPASYALGLVILAGALFWGVAFVVAAWAFLA